MFLRNRCIMEESRTPSVAPRAKVELHVHLDGAVRTSTAWELAQKKKIDIPGINSFIEFEKACTVTKPENLWKFLQKFALFWVPFSGDLDAMERLAYEFCEDEYYAGVIYAEARYSPRLAMGDKVMSEYGTEVLDEVIRRVSEGLRRGQEDFGVITRQILCAQYSEKFNDLLDTLRLCQKHYNLGVVGIDLLTLQPPDGIIEEAPVVEPIISVFREAAQTGVHRTVHAAECSSAEAVWRAYYQLGSERIGHGYHVVRNPTLYNQCLRDRVHFECCPYSSLMTGSVDVIGPNHPICRFARDGANFSINSDDPTVTGHTVQKDHELLASWGLNTEQLSVSTLNGIRSSFLNEDEKVRLIQKLNAPYISRRIHRACNLV